MNEAVSCAVSCIDTIFPSCSSSINMTTEKESTSFPAGLSVVRASTYMPAAPANMGKASLYSAKADRPKCSLRLFCPSNFGGPLDFSTPPLSVYVIHPIVVPSPISHKPASASLITQQPALTSHPPVMDTEKDAVSISPHL